MANNSTDVDKSFRCVAAKVSSTLDLMHDFTDLWTPRTVEDWEMALAFLVGGTQDREAW